MVANLYCTIVILYNRRCIYINAITTFDFDFLIVTNFSNSKFANKQREAVN